MKTFFAALRERNNKPEGRRWLFVPYDQLSDRIGPLAREDPRELGIVMVETPWKASRRPYHKQKLATILANARHFALEQAERGVAVRYSVVDGSYAEALRPLGPLRVMEPAERELRADLVHLGLETLPHEGWLTTRAQFLEHAGRRPPWRMDAFYRGVRRATGILMERDGRPVGGRFSFDSENRQPWRGTPAVPELPQFAVDAVTREVCALIDDRFAEHPGELHPESLPATQADALVLWRDALSRRLPHFGPYEDAMATREPTLFHARVSALVNLHRLLPRDLLNDVLEDASLPLASREAFVRQLLGWREYMRHIHVETDGFRRLPTGRTPRRATPGDGGYARWSGRAWPTSSGDKPLDGGAAPSALESNAPVPAAYWGKASGLACLDRVVRDVWRDGYSHHITRLMVLSNIAQLLDVAPRELADWFWVAYTDAYDWVVEPNVLMMSTFGVSDLGTTKPYVAGAAYINRMSDYCEHCDFDPKRTCPLTRMYWAYLERHATHLEGNPRIAQQVRSASARSVEHKADDARVFRVVSQALAEGARLTPALIDPDASR